MFARSSLGKESIERIVHSVRTVLRHLSVWLNAMFETVEFPAGVAYLYSCLTDVYTDALTLCVGKQ